MQGVFFMNIWMAVCLLCCRAYVCVWVNNTHSYNDTFELQSGSNRQHIALNHKSLCYKQTTGHKLRTCVYNIFAFRRYALCNCYEYHISVKRKANRIVAYQLQLESNIPMLLLFSTVQFPFFFRFISLFLQMEQAEKNSQQHWRLKGETGGNSACSWKHCRVWTKKIHRQNSWAPVIQPDTHAHTIDKTKQKKLVLLIACVSVSVSAGAFTLTHTVCIRCFFYLTNRL